VSCPTTVFKTASIDHSDISPNTPFIHLRTSCVKPYKEGGFEIKEGILALKIPGRERASGVPMRGRGPPKDAE
jgi:hypothetical protein